MKTMKACIAVAAAFAGLALPAQAMAQEVGDWVLSPWRGSSVYYPGVVESRSGALVTVRFDDGDVETRQANTVLPFDWQAGSRVACLWSDNKWYNAVIRSIASDGFTMQIRYDDDGTIENTNTGRCRTR
ncbi:hypothetical protein C7451_102301 [Blastomonas natatoria]|uniref:Tudor domain-containing protein n=1 Tax=Blastomonas natatoria TaxID=34015 RepID=A0A2V3VPZ9_9SPHN|nr:hypothetical protein [Blastomonas natatoria]PXW78629.1 hypothetical protein C7451_102301 [Blastomonas natatoria]